MDSLEGFTAPIVAGTLSILVVLLAFLVNRFAPDKRRHIRTTVLFFICYLLAFGVTVGLGYLLPRGVGPARVTAEALGVLVVINVAGLALFDLGLPAIRLQPARILVDLAMGIAYVVATFAILRRAGVELVGLVTTSAVATGILALSLQTTLGNVIGGVALQIDDSIKPGDWIQLENGKQGVVKQIRWRHTVIETRDWDTIIVPNAALLGASITILGKRTAQPLQHRMWVHFSIDCEHRPGDVIGPVEQALRAASIPGVAADPPPNCICYDFPHGPGESSARYAVRYWLTDLARDDPTSSLVRTRVHAALERAGIPLALPASEMHVEVDDADRRARNDRGEHDRRMAAIDGLPFLRPLNADERARIADSLRFTPFAAGETMTKQGAVAHWLYIVTRGVAEVVVERDGERRTIAKIHAPNFFGEMGCMTGTPRAATVVAETDVVCYRLDKDAFVQILTERPEMAKEISELLAERRVGLGAARHDLDEAARAVRLRAEKLDILETLQGFFGLGQKPGAKA